jgi:hypothetical protein
LTYAGYCCPCASGRFCGGLGHSEYPGAELHFSNCLEEWFEELMVGRLDSVALGDAVQQLFQVFGVYFHGRGQYVNIYPFGEWDFEDAGKALLWGSLSGVPGDWFFGADAGGSV